MVKRTIIDILEQHAELKADQVAYTMADVQGNVTDITFKQLHQRVGNRAGFLRQFIDANKKAVILLPNNIEFIYTFLACLYAGITAIPLACPKGKRHTKNFTSLLEAIGPDAIISYDELLGKLILEQALASVRTTISIDQQTDANPPIIYQANDIAFLQYTSGSTSLPKGVVITHENIMSNQEQIKQAFQHDEQSLVVGWLPFFHDMGLIGNILQPLYCGIQCVLIAPETFLAKPELWLSLISSYQASTSGGPNFAYDFCVEKLRNYQFHDLDLSTWKVAFNGSEQISHKTIDEFTNNFAKYGFQKHAFLPCYGLAEGTLLISAKQYMPADADNKFVNCGHTYCDTVVKIINPDTEHECKIEEIGEICISGSTVTCGYYINQNIQQDNYFYTIADKAFFRTGDLGFCNDRGEIFVTGRIKELIIINGKNISPADLTLQLKQSCLKLSNHRIVPICNDSKITLLIEIDRNSLAEINEQDIGCCKSVINADFGVELRDIIFLRKNYLPRTTSGKIKYHQCASNYGKYLSNKYHLKRFTAAVTNKLPKLNLTGDIDSESILELLVNTTGIPATGLKMDLPLAYLGIDSIKLLNLYQQLSSYLSDEPLHYDALYDLTINDLLSKLNYNANEKILNQQTYAKLSIQQRNIFNWQLLNPNDASYNIPIVIELNGMYNIRKAIKAIRTIVNDNPVLSQYIVKFDEEYIQLAKPKAKLPIHFLDKVATDTEAMLQFEKYSVIPFTLHDELPWRLYICSFRPDRHLILLNIHHVVIDGWSTRLLVQSFADLYGSAISKQSIKTSNKLANYYQYAIEQPQYNDHDLSAVKAYLKAPIASEPLYIIKNNGPENKLSVNLEQALLTKLNDYCHENGNTIPQLMLAIYHKMINRLTNESETYIGYANANRHNLNYINTMGCFVSSNISTVGHTGNAFKDIISDVKTGMMLVDRHSPIDLSLLADYKPYALRHFFVMQNAFRKFEINNHASIRLCDVLTPMPMYDLIFEVSVEDDGITWLFEHSSNYHHQCVKEFASLMEHELRQFLAIDCNDNYDDAELIEPINKIASQQCMLHKFAKKVHKTPGHIAVIAADNAITYQDLWQKISVIAHNLNRLKLMNASNIVLPMRRSVELIAAIYACLITGHTYVPIDLQFYQNRLGMIIDDCKPQLIVTDNEDICSQYQNAVHVNSLLEFDVKELKVDIKPGKFAYTIYTSGSTGQPKGVLVAYSALNNFVNNASDIFKVTNKSRVLQFSSIGWDTFSEEVFPTLTKGGTVILRENDQFYSFDKLLTLTTKHRINVWNLPSSYWHALINQVKENETKLPNSLDLVIVGGEPVPKAAIKDWFNLAPQYTRLMNTYGTTEATSISAFDLITRNDFENASHIAIGKPYPGVKLLVLNKQGQSLPAGVIGELHIAGQGLAEGYLNNDVLTEAKFTKITNGATVLKTFNTNDLAYQDHQGKFYVLGRSDDIIKRNGVRIALIDIENCVMQNDKIDWCKTVFNKDANQVTLFIKPIFSDYETIESELHNDIRSTLSSHYLPDHIKFINSIPRLANGKVDINKLDNFVIDKNTNPVDVLSDPKLTAIQEIWQEVLTKPIKSMDASFFDVNGDSLKLINLHGKLQSKFDVNFDIAELFTNATCRQQAGFVNSIIANDHDNLGRIKQ